MNRTLKKRLSVLSLLQRIEFKLEGETYYLFYNEEDISETDAKKLLKNKDFSNKHIITITKDQYNTVLKGL